MSTENYEYGCNQYNELGKRCYEMIAPGQYKTLEECNANCYTTKEAVAVERIGNTVMAKDLVSIVAPKVIITSEKIKDVPLLNFNGNPYNRPYFNSNEIQDFRKILASNVNIDKNYFLNDIIKKTECIRGSVIKINIDIDKKSATNLQDIEIFKKFELEIKQLIDNNANALYKDVLVRGDDFNHACCLICKYDKVANQLNFFYYDPTFDKINQFDILEKHIIGLKKKRDDVQIKITNLSRIYGLQNFEVVDFTEDSMFLKMLSQITKEFDKLKLSFVKFLNEDNFNTVISILDDGAIQEKLSQAIKQKHFKEIYDSDKEIFKQMLDLFIHDYCTNVKHMMTDTLKFTKFTDIQDFTGSVNLTQFDLFNTVQKVMAEITEIKKEVNEKFNMDFYYNYCYMWCVYTTILIMINPNVDPYQIVQYSFYQTDRENEMRDIFNDYKLGNFETYFKEYKSNMFTKEFITNELNEIKQNKANILKRLTDPSLLRHNKILYTKITNLIILNIKYNVKADKKLVSEYIKSMEYNPMLLPKIRSKQECGCCPMMSNNYFNVEKFKKTLDDLDLFTYDGIGITDEIIAHVILGESHNSLSYKILDQDLSIAKVSKQAGGSSTDILNHEMSYEEVYAKYMKYKRKYANTK